MIWKPIVGWEGYYSVSSSGQIRRDMAASGTQLGRELCFGKSRAGYLNVALSRNHKRSKYFVHRLVAEAFIGPRPIGKEINHIDGNPANNSAANLEYVTRQENTLHAIHVLGRRTGNPSITRREGHGMAKLAENDVATIRRTFTGQKGQKAAFARQYGITPTHVSRLLQGRVWKDTTVEIIETTTVTPVN